MPWALQAKWKERTGLDLLNGYGLTETTAYKIAPTDVEQVLYRHPDIRDAAVIGVPDEYRGETVKAFVVVLRQKLREMEAAKRLQGGYQLASD